MSMRFDYETYFYTRFPFCSKIDTMKVREDMQRWGEITELEITIRAEEDGLNGASDFK